MAHKNFMAIILVPFVLIFCSQPKSTTSSQLGDYSYGPPDIVKPSNELYGEWLLEVNRPQEAIAQYDLSLKAAPKRVLSVKGKENALKALSYP